jgi:hypothetical protein
MMISNLTLETGFGTLIDSFCHDAGGCTSLPSISTFNFQNMIFLGFTDSNTPGGPDGNYPGVYCNESCNGSGFTDPNWNWLNNLGYNIHNPPTGGSGNNWALSTAPVVAAIPNITTFLGEANVLTWNMNLTSGSPAIGAGVSNSFVPATDFNGTTMTVPPVIGALIYAGSTPTAATPTFSPVAGTYSSAQSVTISTTTGGAAICYTTDGSTPLAATPGTCSHGTTYTTAVSVATSETLNAIATLASYLNSSTATAAYVITTTSPVSISGQFTLSGTAVVQ